MAAAPRGVEAHSLLGGSYPLLTDAVEKVGATLTTRNNRIAQAGFLNRSCAFDARLESILLEDPLKIFFRRHRPLADIQSPNFRSPFRCSAANVCSFWTCSSNFGWLTEIAAGDRHEVARAVAAMLADAAKW